MASSSNTTSTVTSSSFEAVFNVALDQYTKQTGEDLHNHPLASKIDSCDSPDSILDIFQEQAQTFDEFRKGDIKLFKWLRPVVKVLHDLSNNRALSDSASHVSPATLCYINSHHFLFPRCFRPQRQSSLVSGSFYPCVFHYPRSTSCYVRNSHHQTAKNASASYDALVDIFECVESFIRRLSIYTEIPPTPAMTEIVVKTMVELVSVLALATKQINQGRLSMPVLVHRHPSLTL